MIFLQIMGLKLNLNLIMLYVNYQFGLQLQMVRNSRVQVMDYYHLKRLKYYHQNQNVILINNF
ncbi:hypothetical protein C2G38_2081806 [Gigaspora rosea]|uniref:Uncharacterized protein n=1 Tax=Gigaspora rosea TaxID=44941 RepID=A0A397VJF2_9GLOM|nr:hypothetical protein C2G38_2081806 [Gigaspora rosea]